MPLFSKNGFGGLISQKKPRQGQQNVAAPPSNNLDTIALENSAIKVKLGHNVLCYEDGLWTSGLCIRTEIIPDLTHCLGSLIFIPS